MSRNPAIGISDALLKHLKAIQEAVEKTPPDWEGTRRSFDWFKAVVPKYPGFRPVSDGQPLPVVNWRYVELRNDAERMEYALTRQHVADVLACVMSAQRNAEVIGRSEE
jgi:hypothetical protein